MMRHHPDRILTGHCINCGAGPHEWCDDDCVESYRPERAA